MLKRPTLNSLLLSCKQICFHFLLFSLEINGCQREWNHGTASKHYGALVETYSYAHGSLQQYNLSV